MKSVRQMLGLLLCALWVGSGSAVALEKVVYFHNDALGSPVAATNAQGQVLWTEAYDPYGTRVVKPASAKANQLWYTGKQEEAKLGLNYFGARWYEPGIGRFHGNDPVGFTEENVQSFNKYAYGNNNPYTFVDPDGCDALTKQEAEKIASDVSNQWLFAIGLVEGSPTALKAVIPEGMSIRSTSGAVKRMFGRESQASGRQVQTQIERKIEEQMAKRGWDRDSINDAIANPNRTASTKDTRWSSDGTRRDEPATAYIRKDGHYVVRNDNDGTVVQVSNRSDGNWKSPF